MKKSIIDLVQDTKVNGGCDEVGSDHYFLEMTAKENSKSEEKSGHTYKK